MENWQARTALAIGEEGVNTLNKASVAILGLGGVGAAAAEALCRAGVGELILIDGDKVDETNLNRQLFATRESIGMDKTEAAAKRLKSINPNIKLTLISKFILPDNIGQIFDFMPHSIIDACDTVTAKLALAEQCEEKGIPLFSSMGTGNRFHPEELHLGDIADTAGCSCPLARVIRKELRTRGVKKLMVLYSTEVPVKATESSPNGRHIPGSISFVPPVAGYILAGAAVRAILGVK